MINWEFSFLYGMALAILFAEPDEQEEFEIEWGVVLMLGPLALTIEKTKEV